MEYSLYMDGILLPLTPPHIDIKIKGKNKTVELISGGEINIIKDPGLSEISFTCLLPQFSKYPFARYENNFFKPTDYYLECFEDMKKSRKPFEFKAGYDVSMNFGGVEHKHEHYWKKVTLESYTIKEDVKNGSDIEVSITLKEYRDYGAFRVVRNTATGETAIVEDKPREQTKEPAKTYTIKSGDTLYNISKKELGDANKWKSLYALNKDVIESAAKKYGRLSSSDGHWIYPGCVLNLSVS